MQTEEQSMRHIQAGFEFKDRVLIPCVYLGGWTNAKNQHFQNMVMFHINKKGVNHTKQNRNIRRKLYNFILFY